MANGNNITIIDLTDSFTLDDHWQQLADTTTDITTVELDDSDYFFDNSSREQSQQLSIENSEADSSYHLRNQRIELDDSEYYSAPIAQDNSSREQSSHQLGIQTSAVHSSYHLRNQRSTAPSHAQEKELTTRAAASEKSHDKPRRLGDCPVCCDELGRTQIASAKCGHVFCLSCIKQVVCDSKKCPTCRCVLQGSNAYHPLYL